MIIQEFHLDKYDWDVLIYYAVDTYFTKDILHILRLLRCPKDIYLEALDLLVNFKFNRGFTYSNFDCKCTIIIIGLTNSAAEFQDTFDHEKGHLAMHICQALYIDPFSEEFQYLVGNIGKKAFPVARKFLCDDCRKNMFNNWNKRGGNSSLFL